MSRRATLRRGLALFAAAAALLAAAPLLGDTVAVRHEEGIVHGFLTLRAAQGQAIANGDLIQLSNGDRVTVRLIFHFKDGSLLDETTVFRQRQRFELLSDHLVQKGPAFSEPLDLSIDRESGRVRVRYSEKDGEEKVADEQMDLPEDLANEMLMTLLKNVDPASPPPPVSMIVATPKPRLVKLEIGVAGRDRFSTGSEGREATNYVVKIKIGGLAGLFAPLVGKQPPDSHVWILGGDAPAFIKSEGPLFANGPIWRIELTAPAWPRAASND